MGYFTWILIVFFFNCVLKESSMTDNPDIIFTKLSSNRRPMEPEYYIVLANKPIYFHFQNMVISRGLCFNYYHHSEILDKTRLPIMIQSLNVTAKMSTLWKCNVTEDIEKPKYQVFYFNLHVKGAKFVKVTANSKQLNFSVVDLSVPYDGYTIYFYEDDEHVWLVCKNPQSTGTVHWKNYTKETENALHNAPISVTFGIQLHSGSNNSYIECVYDALEPTEKYVYRVNFVSKKQLFYSNANKTLSDIMQISGNQEKAGEYSALILGSSAAVVLLAAGMAGIWCWYLRTRSKQIEVACMTHRTETATHHNTIEWENSYNASYETSQNLENNINVQDHFYTEIDYLTCKPKVEETYTRNSRVYDEPYVQITIGKLKANVGHAHTTVNHSTFESQNQQWRIPIKGVEAMKSRRIGRNVLDHATTNM